MVPLLCRAVFSAGVGYTGDKPFSVLPHEIEEIGSAVVNLAVDEEIERRPYYSEVVVDADERIVNALFDVRGTRLSYAIGKGFEGHLDGLAVAHEHHGSAGESGLLDGSCVALCHPIEHGLDGGEDSLFFWCCGTQCRGEGAGEHDCGDDQMERMKFL